MSLHRTSAGALALSMALSACSVGGLLGGGKPPTTLVTLTPEAVAPAQIARTVAAGQAVTITVPTAGKELTAVRVPVQVTPTDVQYVANLTLVDIPARLFQRRSRIPVCHHARIRSGMNWTSSALLTAPSSIVSRTGA